MDLAARPVFCELKSDKPAAPLQVQKPKLVELPQTATDNGKIVLQPRLCTLRSYSGDRLGVIKAKNIVNGDDQVSPFFAILSEYIESSKKSQDFEIISGRLAMLVFAATVSIEMVTGNSVFRKMDLQGIEEAAGVCFAAVTSAAIFAWFSSARKGVGRMFTIRCNTLIDLLIDQIIDGLFYEIEPSDWSDDQF
ncbi:stress enhanced protein 2, chloroplastic-like [Olea europaea var. sylvestris]|uniref:Stress enhanced 2, chloroplastic n=1 Tax=Olea europaea subsp. europaea TaxID=158383 RepID=A0A8S0RTY0_OLEEU|nr:stress enhanced protein 2, chloroplastic-like [Olea europaea var. sylvestris]CAA2983000.1 stress enhanced 2, chloroplastic [Olea europaea subsp. europaea]